MAPDEEAAYVKLTHAAQKQYQHDWLDEAHAGDPTHPVALAHLLANDGTYAQKHH